jgi:hypothetical protein
VHNGGVGKQHQLIIPEAVRELAAMELYPGETMLALCEFWAEARSPRLLALTEANLRYMRLSRSNNGFARVETRSLDRRAADPCPRSPTIQPCPARDD